MIQADRKQLYKDLFDKKIEKLDEHNGNFYSPQELVMKLNEIIDKVNN